MARALGLGSMGPGGMMDDEYDPDEYDDVGLTDGLLDDDEADTGGAFESYADTVFNPESTPEEKTAALREAIRTVVEEGTDDFT